MNTIIDLTDQIKGNDWLVAESEVTKLSAYEQSFFSNEFLGFRSLSYYEKRLQKIGFVGKKNVLDLACGMGQWSIALANLNDDVVGIDCNQGRLEFAKMVARGHQKSNCRFDFGSMETVPTERAQFDAVFCYGAFMFANMPKAMQEIRRICKPGALIYLNANALGWYFHLLLDRGLLSFNFEMAGTALKMIFRGMLSSLGSRRFQTQMMVLPSYICKLADANGIEVVAVAPEGGIGTDAIKTQSAYPSKYYGATSIYEYVLQVKGNTECV